MHCLWQSCIVSKKEACAQPLTLLQAQCASSYRGQFHLLRLLQWVFHAAAYFFPCYSALPVLLLLRFVQPWLLVLLQMGIVQFWLPVLLQMGIGRTTTGMVVASLVHMYHLQALAHVR